MNIKKIKQNVVIHLVFLNFVYWTPFLQALESKISLQFGIIGDCGWLPQQTEALRQSLISHKISHLILPGDNLYNTNLNYNKIWDIWKKQGFVFDLVAIGNHNLSYDSEMTYFKMKNEFYKKEIRNNSFYILNSDNIESVDEQLQWLENSLRNDPNPHIFLIYHHPTFTVSTNHKWQEKLTFQLKMRSLLKHYANRISSVIVGHDHISSMIQINELPLIISGSGVEVKETQSVDYFEDGFQIKTMWLAPKSKHWVKLIINESESKLTYDFIDVKSGKRSWSYNQELNHKFR